MQEDKRGINRQHNSSLKQKIVFITLHAFIIIISLYIVLEGVEIYDKQRAWILFGFSFIYFLRHITTLFYLLQRQVDWGEVFGLSSFFGLFEIGLLLLGAGVFHQHAIAFDWIDSMALILFFLGSYLNTYSELQRKWWKNDLQNKGKVYTKGLFSHAMHINFFGDVVLFTGWVMMTHTWWAFFLPLFMLVSFVFFHIPTLDEYLLERYGNAFDIYAKKTKKLIPRLY